MSQIEVSPGGVGFIRTPAVSVPGVPSTAKRQKWVNGSTPAQIAPNDDAPATHSLRGSARPKG